MLEYSMLEGESRYITLTLTSRKNEPVIVASAVYDLYDAAGVSVDAGSCEIDGKQLRLLLSPPVAGIYRLLVTYTLPPEMRKTAVTVYVKEDV